jgi:class 3 adenylate cyclase
VIQVEWSGVRGWLEPLESLNERVLATVLVTDIVGSTGHATRLGGAGGTISSRVTTPGCETS